MNTQGLDERLEDGVLAVVLFGSVATGLADDASDVDVFVMCRPSLAAAVRSRKPEWAAVLDTPASGLTVYTEDVVRKMAERGALLLHHMRLEGRVLLDRGASFGSLELQQFNDFETETCLLERLLAGVVEAWEVGRVPTALDLHILQVVIRNACILLTVSHGQPAFGRVSAVFHAKSLSPGLPIDDHLYRELVTWHLIYLRGQGEMPFPDTIQRSAYLRMTGSVLNHVKAIVC